MANVQKSGVTKISLFAQSFKMSSFTIELIHIAARLGNMGNTGNTLSGEFPVYRFHALVNYQYNNSILAAPRVSLPSVVETLPGYEVEFSVNGTLPLNTTIMKDSTALFTGVESTAALIFYEEGNFTCMASNLFGSYFKEFSVIFRGMN